MANDLTKRLSSPPPPANPRIKRILKSYQQTAERTLNGPRDDEGTPVPVHRGVGAAAVASRPSADGAGRGARPPVSRDQGPAGRSRDHGPFKRSGPTLVRENTDARGPGKCEVVETVLEGERIACFEVGGEQRLCMPQILSTVLRNFEPAEVFDVCEQLHIFFCCCDPVQLGAMIRAKVLPPNVQSCGLITYTNAERMCSTLLQNQSAYKYRLPVAIEGLKVYHECFGGCRGVFVLEAFESPTARCVQCAECGEMFAPAQFVSHSHCELENGTIHWGFNPGNWKSYLMLSLEQTGYPRVQELLDGLKTKFQDDSDNNVDKIVIKQEVDDGMPVKRIRYDKANILPKAESTSPNWVPADFDGAWRFCIGLCKQLDDIKIRSHAKLPGFLQTEAPFMADSDRVISYTESQWADRNFAPNVSLDPTPYKSMHDLYDDDCDEKEPAVDEKDVTMTQSHNWSSSMTSSGISALLHASNSGNVSDDDSDDRESILSDKLPAMAEDEDEACERISSLCNARLGLLIRALEGEVHRSELEDPVKEFVKLQDQQSDVIGSLADNNNALAQRRLFLWTLMEDKLRAMEEMRKNQDEELVCLKQENAMKTREALRERRRLMEQIEKLSKASPDSDIAAVAQYREEAEILRKQLQNAEEMNTNLRREIADLHRAIEELTQSSSSERGGLYHLPLVIQRPEVAPTAAAMSGVLSGRLSAHCPLSSV